MGACKSKPSVRLPPMRDSNAPPTDNSTPVTQNEEFTRHFLPFEVNGVDLSWDADLSISVTQPRYPTFQKATMLAVGEGWCMAVLNLPSSCVYQKRSVEMRIHFGNGGVNAVAFVPPDRSFHVLGTPCSVGSLTGTDGLWDCRKVMDSLNGDVVLTFEPDAARCHIVVENLPTGQQHFWLEEVPQGFCLAFGMWSGNTVAIHSITIK